MATGPLVAAAPYLTEQKYQDYTPDQHAVWAELVRRRRPQIDAHACQEYLEGYEIIGLQDDRLPNLRAISDRIRAPNRLEHNARERVSSRRSFF